MKDQTFTTFIKTYSYWNEESSVECRRYTRILRWTSNRRSRTVTGAKTLVNWFHCVWMYWLSPELCIMMQGIQRWY